MERERDGIVVLDAVRRLSPAERRALARCLATLVPILRAALGEDSPISRVLSLVQTVLQTLGRN